MFKPTKPQHITNKAYVDANSGGGGGSAKGIVVEFDYFDRGTYDKGFISKTKIVSAVNSFKEGGVVVFHIPDLDGWWDTDQYMSVTALITNATYYPEGGGEEAETVRFYVDENVSYVSNLQWESGYVDESGYYNIKLYID